MEPDFKTEAETLRQLLLRGLVDLRSVRSWADARIESAELPSDWLVDVAMARDKYVALSALNAAPGLADMAVVRARQMHEYLRLLERVPEQDAEVAKDLYFIGVEEATPSLEAELMSFWDAIDLARAGIYGSIADERTRLLAFLKFASEVHEWRADAPDEHDTDATRGPR